MESQWVNDPVLVAVDGSPASLAALDWAADYAQSKNLSLTVVTAAPPLTASMSGSPTSYLRSIEEAEHTTRARVQKVIEHRLQGTDVPYTHVVSVTGPMLRRHSTNASVAVVGTRPSTGLGRWLRRSNTNRITGSLSCPVVSVTTTADASTPAVSRHLVEV